MSIFGNIMSAVFRSAHPAATARPPSAPSPAPPPSAPPVSTSDASTGTMERVDDKTRTPGAGESKGASAPASNASTGSAATALDRVDVAAVLTRLAAQNKEKLDWRRSIVDLMKLLNLDSSHVARKQLAKELHYAGDMNDSAAMNIWLHKQVMQKLAENGGKVPADLTAR
jgi:hypothetical protein